jgi:uncharacterized membrane protein
MQKFQKPSKTNQITVTETSLYSGKLPPPDMMEKYNSIDSTFAGRIIKMAEEEQKHVHSIENKQLKVSFMMATFGILAGLIALGTLCYLLYLAIEKENTSISLGITGIIASVITVFVLNKRQKNN